MSRLNRVHVAQYLFPHPEEAALHLLLSLALELSGLALGLAGELVGLALCLACHLVRLALGLSGGLGNGLLYSIGSLFCGNLLVIWS
jgi:hypothetical protein